MFRLMTSKANYANSYTFDLTTASSEDTGSLLALFEAHGLQHFFRVVGRSFIEIGRASCRERVYSSV